METRDHNTGFLFNSCNNCGKYAIGCHEDTLGSFPFKNFLYCGELNYRKHSGKKSAALYSMAISGDLGPIFEKISKDDLNNMLPKNTTQRFEKAFINFASDHAEFGQHFTIDNSLFPRYYCKNESQYDFLRSTWREQGYIVTNADSNWVVTAKGWAHFESLTNMFKKHVKATQVFVAMSFDAAHELIYSDAIEPAIIECGYIPKIIKEVEFNSGVMDAIISEIRNSRFVIADFTGNKNGVYYEAAFASGLNLEVIKGVHKSHMDTEYLRDNPHHKLHFDVTHLNFIVHESNNEYKNRIVKRIKAMNL